MIEAHVMQFQACLSEQPPWWQQGVIYQIDLRSFQDSNGDGIGDLAGVIQRLDYLSEVLGVDALWLTPFYPSPMADGGYDITDYLGVDPLFGDLATFDRLLKEAHARGLHVILDYVPNHTSDQHPWFLESRSSRHNPRKDWYIWADSTFRKKRACSIYRRLAEVASPFRLIWIVKGPLTWIRSCSAVMQAASLLTVRQRTKLSQGIREQRKNNLPDSLPAHL